MGNLVRLPVPGLFEGRGVGSREGTAVGQAEGRPEGADEVLAAGVLGVSESEGLLLRVGLRDGVLVGRRSGRETEGARVGVKSASSGSRSANSGVRNTGPSPLA